MSTDITSTTTKVNSSPSSSLNYDLYNSQFIPRTTLPPTSKLLNNENNENGSNEVAIMDDSDDESDSDNKRKENSRRYSHSNDVSQSSNSKAKNNHHTLLSTQSPQGIAAASQITPNRLAKLLITTGPLPIRHITKHLSQQIPDFALLSLSKQRRLIMAALEMGDEETGCVFEKVGWGQWATKQIGSQDVINYNNSKPKQISLSTSPPTIRRQSITNPNNDPHNTKVPYNPSSLDEAVIESSSSMNSSSDDEESDIELDDEDDEDIVFKMEKNGSTSPKLNGNEVRFSSRVLNSVPLQQQQQLQQPQRRSLSSSQQRRGSSSHGIRKPKQQQVKTRLNSFDYYELKFDGNSIEGVLDLALVPDSILIRKKPRSSFSESFMRSTPTPSVKISSEENLPLPSSSSPILDEPLKQVAQLDTDEEDWQSIGADKLSAAYTLLMIKKED